MANKYANLIGTNLIKDEYTKINTGFDAVETDINTLAKKGWGETYDAVLQNGWSGALKYAKNDIGEVWLAGYLTVGTVTTDTTIATIPNGYYPLLYSPSILCFRVSPRKIIPGLYISMASKELRIIPPASDDLTAGQQVYVHAIYRTV